MDKDQPPQKGQIQVQIDEATAQGAYANLAAITHSETEFLIDFLFLQPHEPKAKVRSRILTSPLHAKRFLAALEENVRKYESQFGEIKFSKPPAEPKIGFYH